MSPRDLRAHRRGRLPRSFGPKSRNMAFVGCPGGLLLPMLS